MSDSRENTLRLALMQVAFVLGGSRPTPQEFEGAARVLAHSDRLASSSVAAIVAALDRWAEDHAGLEGFARPQNLPGARALSMRLSGSPEPATVAPQEPQGGWAGKESHPMFAALHGAFGAWVAATQFSDVTLVDPDLRQQWRDQRDQWLNALPKSSDHCRQREAEGEDLGVLLDGLLKGAGYDSLDTVRPPTPAFTSAPKDLW